MQKMSTKTLLLGLRTEINLGSALKKPPKEDHEPIGEHGGDHAPNAMGLQDDLLSLSLQPILHPKPRKKKAKNRPKTIEKRIQKRVATPCGMRLFGPITADFHPAGKEAQGEHDGHQPWWASPP